MEVVRKYIDASSLMSVKSLPESLKNRRLEVIVLPADEQNEKENRAIEVEKIVNSLVGVIPSNDMSLSEFREERLSKYENID